MNRRALFPVTFLLLLVVALAARWLSYDVLYADEWWSVLKSGGDLYGPLSPLDIWNRIVTVDPGGMGPGYYLALGGWQALVGSTPFAIRAFSLMCGVLAAAMTYRLGCVWFSPRVGIFAAALMASSAFFVNFMHEARAYTLVTLMMCCVMYAYWRLVRLRRPRLFDYAALTLSLAGLAYAHYIVLPGVAAALGVYHLFFLPKSRRWLNIAAAMVAAAVLFVPWLPVIAEIARRGTDDINRQNSSMTAGQGVQALVEAFSNGSPALLFMLLAVGGWLLWLAFRRSEARWRFVFHPASTTLLVSWLAMGLAVSLLVNAFVPFLVHLRYLIFLWPALAIAAAVGIDAIMRRGVPLSLVLGVWMLFGVGQSLSLDFMRGLYGEIYRPPAAGIDRAMALLGDIYEERDLVLFHIAQPGFEPFSLFIEDYLTRNLTGTQPNPVARAQTEFMNNSGVRSDFAYRADVLSVLNGHTRVWIADVPEIATTQRTDVLYETLAESYSACGTPLVRDDATLALFVQTPDLEAFRANPPYVFGSDATGIARMQILGGGIGAAQDKRLSVTLGWLPQAVLRDGSYSVAVHLTDDAGNVIAQDDYPLAVNGYGCRFSLFPADLPAGTYQFYVSVYHWQTLETLPVEGVSDGRISLGTVEVE